MVSDVDIGWGLLAVLVFFFTTQYISRKYFERGSDAPALYSDNPIGFLRRFYFRLFVSVYRIYQSAYDVVYSIGFLGWTILAVMGITTGHLFWGIVPLIQLDPTLWAMVTGVVVSVGNSIGRLEFNPVVSMMMVVSVFTVVFMVRGVLNSLFS